MPLYPNQPTGYPDWYSTSGYGPSSQQQQPQQHDTNAAFAASQAAEDARRWDQEVERVRQALAQSAGWDREKKTLELADAEKGRANAWKIAELSAQTSRYGTDRNAEVQLAQLKETQRQFDQNHGLEMQKFGLEEKKYGLNVADSYANYAQTADQAFAMNDFKDAMGRVGQGLSPSMVGSNGATPHAKTWEDFAALSGFSSLPVVQQGQAANQPFAEGPAGMAQQGGAGAGAGSADPRIKAMKAVADAMPPSDSVGHDEQDWAGLDAIKNLWFARKPGQVERLGQARRQIGMAGLKRLGFDPNLVEQDRIRAGVGQGSVSSA